MPISINGTTGISGVDGSAGTPALQGTDTNTGIAFGSDVILASTGGTERLRIDSSGRVGIGTSSPGAGLHIVSAGQTTSAVNTAGDLNTIISDTGIAAGNGGSLVFAAASGQWRFASIKGLATNGSNNTQGDIVFSTRQNATDSALTERVRLDSQGRVGIGTQSPGYPLTVVSDASTQVLKICGRSSDNISNIAFSSNNQGTDYAFITAGPTYLATSVNGSERTRIDSSGNFAFNSGYGSVATAYGCRAWVNFNGTGVVAIRASGNVSSITDNGTGDYTVNFTTAMPDANYAAIGTTGPKGANSEALTVRSYVSAGSVRIETHAGGSAAGDCANNNLAIFR